MNQAQPALVAFIMSSYAKDRRLVLVITGKGQGKDHEDNGGDRKLWHKGESLLVHRSRGLDDANDQTRRERAQQHWAAMGNQEFRQFFCGGSGMALF